jgi:hypothetical protein
MRFSWLWPMTNLLWALAAALVTLVIPNIVLRPAVVMGFLFTCPGMVLVRFFRLRDGVAEWTLAIALSLALDAIIASIQLYIGWWSPGVTLSLLIGLCVVGAILQLRG